MADDFFESLVQAVGVFVGAWADTPNSGGNDALRDLMGIPEALEKIRDHPIALKTGPQHQGIALIRDIDPDFDIGMFLVRVGEMFSAYHTAMDRGDLAPIRRFVDERYYPDLLEAAEKTGRNPNGPRALTVKAIRPMTASHYLGMDMIRVFITANQSGTKELLCEYWELIRKQGTLTKPDLDLTSCPNCGGPVNGLDKTRCSYCGTRLADPAHDWVVRSILPQ
jgi:hypothetical protein